MPYETVDEHYVRQRQVRVCERCRGRMSNGVNRSAYQTGGSLAGSLGGSVAGSMLLGGPLGIVGSLAGAVGGAVAGSRVGAKASNGLASAVESTSGDLCQQCKLASQSPPPGYQNFGSGRLDGGAVASSGSSDAGTATIGGRVSSVAQTAGGAISGAAQTAGGALSGAASRVKQSLSSSSTSSAAQSVAGGYPGGSAFKPFSGQGHALGGEGYVGVSTDERNRNSVGQTTHTPGQSASGSAQPTVSERLSGVAQTAGGAIGGVAQTAGGAIGGAAQTAGGAIGGAASWVRLSVSSATPAEATQQSITDTGSDSGQKPTVGARLSTASQLAGERITGAAQSAGGALGGAAVWVKQSVESIASTGKEIKNTEDFKIGEQYEVLHAVTVRHGESLDSEAQAELPAGKVARILEVGVENKRRAKIATDDGIEGWISLATKDAEFLLGKLHVPTDDLLFSGVRREPSSPTTEQQDANVQASADMSPSSPKTSQVVEDEALARQLQEEYTFEADRND